MRKVALLFLMLFGVAAHAQQRVPINSGVVSINTDQSQRYLKVTLNQNVTTFTFTGTPVPGTPLTVLFTQDATGGRTVTGFDANVTNSCSISSTASATTICLFSYDSTTASWTGTALGGGGGGSITGTVQATSFGVKPDVQYAYAVTCNNVSSTITTGANDPVFKSSDVGKIIVGTTILDVAANCPPQGTITGFTSAHTVTVSNAATATTTTGSLAWGSQDDGANLQAAFTASLAAPGGCLILPAGGMFFSLPPFVDTRATTAVGVGPCVKGQGNTTLTPLPGFNYANCFLNGACGVKFAQCTNCNPNYGLFKDFEFLGVGYNLTGTGTTNTWVDTQRNTIENVWVWNMGSGTGSGIGGAGPSSIFSSIVFFSGSIGCSITGTGGTSAGLNQIVTMEQGYCQAKNGALSTGSGSALKTKGMQFGSNSNGPNISLSGIWDSWGDGISQASGTADTIRLSSGGVANLNGDWVIGVSGNTFGAIDCNASGATVNLKNTNVDGGGGGGLSLRSVSGCVINDLGGNTIVQGATSLAGPVYWTLQGLGGTVFANLGTPANGTFTFCSNCTIANPCATGGTGAFAKRLNGVWVCN